MATETDCLVERDYAGEILETTKRCYEELKKTSEMLLAENQKMRDEIEGMKAEIEKQKGINKQLLYLSYVVACLNKYYQTYNRDFIPSYTGGNFLTLQVQIDPSGELSRLWKLDPSKLW